MDRGLGILAFAIFICDYYDSYLLYQNKAAYKIKNPSTHDVILFMMFPVVKMTNLS